MLAASIPAIACLWMHALLVVRFLVRGLLRLIVKSRANVQDKMLEVGADFPALWTAITFRDLKLLPIKDEEQELKANIEAIGGHMTPRGVKLASTNNPSA